MKTIFCVAGGTGGHINAAIAVGEVFNKIYHIKYLTGTRHLDYQLFRGKDVTHLESRPLRVRSPLKVIVNLLFNGSVFLKIFCIYLLDRPKFVIGTGGYICGPTLMAAKLQFIPIFIVEQNAVSGLTNKILARMSDLVFTNFKKTKGIKTSRKVIIAGNPIRSSIQTCSNQREEKLKILAFGGSLGAGQINEAIRRLLRQGFFSGKELLHQVGKGHLDDSASELENYEQVEYIENMQEAYEWCDIIISRAGASTVSELRVIQKPAIIIPFPLATDNHQYHNAKELKKEDGFFVDILDHSLSEEKLANEIQRSVNNIQENGHFYRNKVRIYDADQTIKAEILNYVRNK